MSGEEIVRALEAWFAIEAQAASDDGDQFVTTRSERDFARKRLIDAFDGNEEEEAA